MGDLHSRARLLIAGRLTAAMSWVAKCETEVKAFSEMDEAFQPFVENWQRNLAAAHEDLADWRAIDFLLQDRDEWREQHENLLSVRRSDLRALTARIDALEADNARLREALNGYRAAASFVGADAWDGCPDCIEILRAARCADTDWDWASDPNRVAEELAKVRTARTALEG